MARPRKNPAEPVDGVDVAEMPIQDDEKLKDCPKCGSPCTGAYQDKHGNYRCNCSHPKCGFWDSVVSLNPQDARRKWQQCGGPNPEGFHL